MEKEFFDMITEYFINERLGDIMMQDEKYVRLQNKIWEHMEWLKEAGMDEEQHLAIEELLLLHIRSIDLYTQKAYEYGFKDCISAIRKLGLIKKF